MATKKPFLLLINCWFLNNRGQSAVEYILLMAVLAALSLGVLRSPLFKDLLGNNSVFFKTLGSRVQFSYRHGFEGQTESDSFNYGTATHQSYWNLDENRSRIFLNSDKYPE